MERDYTDQVVLPNSSAIKYESENMMIIMLVMTIINL